MNTFLIDKNRMNDDDVVKVTFDCLQQKVQRIAKIGGGANNKVYHVTCTSQQYVVKFYFRHPLDSRDRLGIEFKSFQYLWEQGLRLIPKPIAYSREHQCAFYEFIKGSTPSNISQADIDAAADFLSLLKGMGLKAENADLSMASEAFFCVKDIVDNIQSRFERIDRKTSGDEYDQLYTYLNKEFVPLFKAVSAWSKKQMAAAGIAYEQQLSQEYRTLSPSDFGFHNALRTAEGKIIYLDFEYFGWDDPAKLVSDFLLHPAMDIPEEFKKHFVSRMEIVFGKDPNFKTRFKSLLPLFGLKWCLIFLNEFIPTELERRDFALSPVKNKAEVRLRQLAKAKCMSDKIKSMYKDFSCGS